MDAIRPKHPHTGFVVIGNFNQLPEHRIKANGQLVQLVNAPTRGVAVLDKLLTDMQDVYSETLVCAPVGTADHNVVLCRPTGGKILDTGMKSTRERKSGGAKGESHVCTGSPSCAVGATLPPPNLPVTL